MKTELYILPLSEISSLPESYGMTHFPRRMERANRFLRREDRLRCIGAGALLHRVLGLREDTLRTGEQGKPYGPEGSPFFSLSHSGDYVLLAVDDGEVGADIEQMDPSHLPLARKIFLPEEQDWMRKDPLKGFYTLWTLKESVMKQCGRGISLSPDSFSVLPLLWGEGLTLGETTLYAVSGQWEEHCFSLCAPHRLEPVLPRLLPVQAFLSP